LDIVLINSFICVISVRACSTNLSRSIPAGGKISWSTGIGEIVGGPRWPSVSKAIFFIE